MCLAVHSRKVLSPWEFLKHFFFFSLFWGGWGCFVVLFCHFHFFNSSLGQVPDCTTYDTTNDYNDDDYDNCVGQSKQST